MLNPCVPYSDEIFQLFTGRNSSNKSQTVLLDRVFGKLQLSVLYLYFNIIIKVLWTIKQSLIPVSKSTFSRGELSVKHIGPPPKPSRTEPTPTSWIP